MTVQEASQVIDQMDVDTQVVAESSRSGGQGRSARPVFGVVVYAARPGIMQGPVRRLLSHLGKSIANSFN
jgi:hypothetical protein